MITLGHVFAALTDYQPRGQEPALTSVVIDSRQAVKGSLFVAFVGENVDGHDFVEDAFRRGAVAALVQRPVARSYHTVRLRAGDTNGEGLAEMPASPLCLLVDNTLDALQRIAAYWRRRHHLTVVGITGSVGKTSTKELTAAVLSRRGRTLKSEGNYNNEIGLPLTVLQLNARHRYAVLEMGMYATGEIATLCRIAAPAIGVVTNVGPVHLERLGSLEAIVAAKQELVAALPADGVAILNRDEPLVMGMAAHTAARVFTYGLGDNGDAPRADLWADEIASMGLDGIRFRLHYQGATLYIRVPLLGRHSVHTALRAAAVGLNCGLSWDEIVTGLQDRRTQLRLVAVDGPRGSLLIDDTYNSSPESAIAALNLLADLDGRRIAVMGDMLELGAAAEQGHRMVARRAVDVADILITVGPLGRMMGEEALALGMPASHVHILPDHTAAAALLATVIEPDDVILVKGSRGVHLDQLVTALSTS